MTYWYEGRIGAVDRHEACLQRAEEAFEKGSGTSPGDPHVIADGVQVASSRGQHEAATALLHRGLETNPGSAEVRAAMANAHHWNGEHDLAVRLHGEVKRLNPRHAVWYYSMSARPLDASGDTRAALATVREGLQRQADNFPCLLQLASLLGRAGRIGEAREAQASALLLSPEFTLGRVDQWLMTRDTTYVAAFKDGLRAAGLAD